MNRPIDTQRLRQLEEQAQECEREDDYASALEIYEAIDREGWAQVKHLLAMGECCMRIRQRQSARRYWTRAWELDPGQSRASELLDRFFPGWEKVAASTQSPIPPTPAVKAGGLSVEMIQPTKPAPAPARAAAPPAPEQDWLANQLSGQSKMIPNNGGPAGQDVGEPQPVEARVENRVNWSYIMADASEEAASSRRKTPPPARAAQ